MGIPGPGHWDHYRCMEGLGRNSGAGTQREHRVRAKGYEHGILGQVGGMWEDQDRDIGDRESNRGTFTRTEGYQDQDKDMGDWD